MSSIIVYMYSWCKNKSWCFDVLFVLHLSNLTHSLKYLLAFLCEFSLDINTDTHVCTWSLPPLLAHQTVLTNRWPVSALLRGMCCVQTLSLNSLSHTHTNTHQNSKDKHNQLFNTLFLACMCVCVFSYYFCCFYSIQWRANIQEARRVRCEASWLEVGLRKSL